MTNQPGATRELARFYTRSRKFPRMVGRLPEGTRIWGGPYTFTQLAVAIVSMIAGGVTRGLWSTGSLVIDLSVIAGTAWALTFAARVIPASPLNPLVVAAAALATTFGPRDGTFDSRPVAFRRPLTVRGSDAQITTGRGRP